MNSSGTPAPPRLRRAWSVACIVGLFATAGCGAEGPYVWYNQLPRSEWSTPRSDYLIGIGDTVNIRVYGQEGLDANGKIRRDGRIAMPLIGEVELAGKPPSDVAREIEARLKNYVVAPRVTVNVEQSRQIVVSTLGEIGHVGTLNLEPPTGLIEALSQAGGLSEFADKSRIFVLRQFPRWQRIRFTYDAVIHNENGAATFPLRTGDVIIVE